MLISPSGKQYPTTQVSASMTRLLSRRAIIRRILQGWSYLTAMKAHIPQFPIAQAMQHTQRRLVFAAGKKGGYKFIDLATKPSIYEAGVLPNV
jgi:hypothetical protein